MNPLTILFMCKVCRSSFEKITQFIEHKQQAHSREFQNINCIIFEEKILLQDRGYNAEPLQTNSFGKAEAAAAKTAEISFSFKDSEDFYQLDHKCDLRETEGRHQHLNKEYLASVSEINYNLGFYSQSSYFPDIHQPGTCFDMDPKKSVFGDSTTNRHLINTTDGSGASVKHELVKNECGDNDDNKVNLSSVHFSNSVFLPSNVAHNLEADSFDEVEFKPQSPTNEESSALQNVKIEYLGAGSDGHFQVHLKDNMKCDIDGYSKDDHGVFAVSWPRLHSDQDSNQTENIPPLFHFDAETGVENSVSLADNSNFGFSTALFDVSLNNTLNSSILKVEVNEYLEENNVKYTDGDCENENNIYCSFRSFSRVLSNEINSIVCHEEAEPKLSDFDAQLVSLPIVSSEIVSTLVDSVAVSVPLEEKSTIRCSLCPKERYYSEKFKRHHMLKHHPDLKMQCPSCRVENLFWESELEKHIANKHDTAILNFACERCSQCMTSLRGLRKHQKLCEKKKLLPEFEKSVDGN